MPFLDENYLLGSKTACQLYKQVESLPVVDPHNHADVKEIAENRNYPDPWQLFAATDHYVWEVLRKRSVPEEFITGNADPKEKWMKMASVFTEIAGNPVYEWIHLDLKRYLGIDTVLGPDTGEEIWKNASGILKEESKRPQQLISEIGVEVMCSTDDPIDTLEEHDKVNASFGKTIIRPTWRPDKAMKIFSPGWHDYIKKLESRFDENISSLGSLVETLQNSHNYFAEHGCCSSDHGVEVPYAGTAEAEDADRIFKSALSGKTLSCEECGTFMSYILGEMAEMDAEKDFVFQLHIGAVRDVRESIFADQGPDSGGDVSNHCLDILSPLRAFLNRFDNKLKVALYCLDPGHQATLATLARAFGPKVSLGSAWWFNDTPVGMKRQLEYIGSVDLFSNFAGMVSDSRKLLSFGSRFEMFRRVLCDVIGKMTERGQMPVSAAEILVEKMSYSGPKEFFGI